MRRGVFDLLRRGFDNTLANWQVSALRFAEFLLMIAVLIGAVLVILVPIFVSIGITAGSIDSPEEIEEVVGTLLQRAILVVWILLGFLALFVIWTLIHSFIEAGCVRVFVDADRVAGPALDGPRSRYKIFSFDRWLTGAKDGWWTVFWIYNIVWGIVGLILLVPLVPTVIAMFLLRETEGAVVAIGCLGLLLTFMLAIVVLIAAGIWSNRAIVDWAVYRTGAIASAKSAWDAMRRDFGRHILTAIAIFVVSMAGSMFFASFSFFAGLGEALGRSEVFILMTLPLRFLGSILSYALSALIASWFAATYAAIATDPHR